MQKTLGCFINYSISSMAILSTSVLSTISPFVTLAASLTLIYDEITFRESTSTTIKELFCELKEKMRLVLIFIPHPLNEILMEDFISLFQLVNGPGTCIPVCLSAWLFNKLLLKSSHSSKIVYVESICRVSTLSLSAKILVHFADDILVQWPELAAKYPKSKYIARFT